MQKQSIFSSSLASYNVGYFVPDILFYVPGTAHLRGLFIKNLKIETTGQKRWGVLLPERVAAG